MTNLTLLLDTKVTGVFCTTAKPASVIAMLWKYLAMLHYM